MGYIGTTTRIHYRFRVVYDYAGIHKLHLINVHLALSQKADVQQIAYSIMLYGLQRSQEETRFFRVCRPKTC